MSLVAGSADQGGELASSTLSDPSSLQVLTLRVGSVQGAAGGVTPDARGDAGERAANTVRRAIGDLNNA